MEVILEARRDRKKVHFATLMHISSQRNAELEPKHLQKERVVLRGDTGKGRLRCTCSIDRARSFCVSNDGRKSNGCHCKTTCFCGTSICFKMGGRSVVAKYSKVSTSRFMDTSSTAQVAQITVKHRRSRGSSRTNFVRSPACWPRVWKKIEGGSIGTWMGKYMGRHWRWMTFIWSLLSWIVQEKTIRRNFHKTWVGQSTQLRMYVRSSKTKGISVSICGWLQNVWKEEE